MLVSVCASGGLPDPDGWEEGSLEIVLEGGRAARVGYRAWQPREDGYRLMLFVGDRLIAELVGPGINPEQPHEVMLVLKLLVPAIDEITVKIASLPAAEVARLRGYQDSDAGRRVHMQFVATIKQVYEAGPDTTSAILSQLFDTA